MRPTECLQSDNKKNEMDKEKEDVKQDIKSNLKVTTEGRVTTSH